MRRPDPISEHPHQAAGLTVPMPTAFSEYPRRPVHLRKKKDAAIIAAGVLPGNSLTKLAAQQMGELERPSWTVDAHKPDEEHSKKFGEELSRFLSGKGLKFDHTHAANHIIDSLRGGGLHYAPLLKTCILNLY